MSLVVGFEASESHVKPSVFLWPTAQNVALRYCSSVVCAAVFPAVMITDKTVSKSPIRCLFVRTALVVVSLQSNRMMTRTLDKHITD